LCSIFDESSFSIGYFDLDFIFDKLMAFFIDLKMLAANRAFAQKLYQLSSRLALSTTSVACDCTRVGHARIRGRQYLRTYPTLLVYPDGSTVTVRYKEPREIIKLPLDLNEVDEATRTERLALRKRSKKVDVAEEYFEDTFDSREYKFLWKDKKKMGKKN